MDFSNKAIMSVLDDSIKKCIYPLLPPDKKYGPNLWIHVLCKVRGASFQQIKALKMKLEALKL